MCVCAVLPFNLAAWAHKRVPNSLSVSGATAVCCCLQPIISACAGNTYTHSYACTLASIHKYTCTVWCRQISTWITHWFQSGSATVFCVNCTRHRRYTHTKISVNTKYMHAAVFMNANSKDLRKNPNECTFSSARAHPSYGEGFFFSDSIIYYCYYWFGCVYCVYYTLCVFVYFAAFFVRQMYSPHKSYNTHSFVLHINADLLFWFCLGDCTQNSCQLNFSIEMFVLKRIWL